MFDLFRRRDKAVRYLLTVLLGLVALSMVITLIPGYGTPSRDSENVVAVVGGDPITSTEVQSMLQASMRNRQIPPDMLQFYLPQFIDQMITDRALAYQAKRMGFEITDQELATAIRSILMNVMPGEFNRQAYERWLADQNLTVEQFESNVRKNLLLLRLQNLALEGVIVPPQEVVAEFHRRNDKVKLAYLAYSPSKDINVTVTKDEALDFFNKNRSLYKTPEKRTFDVLLASEQKMAAQVTVTDAELRQAYSQNLEQYRMPERVHARHILIKTMDKPAADVPKLEAKANDLLKQLRAGADFAELAKKNSDDTGSAVKGGDLGWITRGQTVKAFEDTAFSLPPNQLSNVVKTEYGFHIIQVLEKEQARVKPFDEVKGELEKEIKRRVVYDRMQNSMDQARADLVKAPKDAKAIAAKYDLEYLHEASVPTGQQIPELGNGGELQASLASARPGEVTPVVQTAPDKLAIATLIGVEPPRPAEFADVDNQIMEQLKASKRAQITNQRRDEATRKIQAAGGSLEAAAKALGVEVKTSDLVTADSTIADLGPATPFSGLFSKPVGSTMGPVTLGDKIVVAKVVEKQPADESKLAADRQTILSTLKRQRALERKELFEAGLIAQLTREGKIKKYPDAIKRLGANYRG